MKKSNLWINLILIFSICINFIFIYFFLSGRFQLIQQQKEVIVPINLEEKEELMHFDYSEDENTEKYKLGNVIEYNQMFYGTWKIVECIPADIPLPSSYYSIDEDGNFVGMDYTTIIGLEITFGEDFVKYSGEKYDLQYGSQTYTHALFSEMDIIGSNYAKSLDITGNYFSIVYFVLPDNYRVTGPVINRPKEMRIGDLCFLYLKDNNTIYASDGNLTYLLERL